MKKYIIILYKYIIYFKNKVLYFLYDKTSYIKYVVFPEKYKVGLGNKRKKTVFLLLNKYIRNSQLLSNEIYNVLNSLNNSYRNEINIETFFYDDMLESNQNSRFIENIFNVNPDFVICSSYSGSNIKQPSVAIVKYAKERLPYTKFINFMWDSSSNKVYDNYKSIFNISDLNLIIDGSKFYDKYNNNLNLIRSFTPQDQEIFFFDKNVKKDIDVLFLGSVSSYRSNRKDYLDYLVDNGINIYQGGGGLETPLTAEEYANLMQRAKIVVNFSFSTDNSHQLKGRVLETLHTGGLLMESKNDITSSYFKPSVDYIEYNSKEELLEKIKYYLINKEEREKMALQGNKKVLKHYNDKIFWNSIFNHFKDKNI